MANLRRIRKYLESRHLPFKLIDLKQKAFTVYDVVEVGINSDEIVKTLIVRTPDRFIALGLRGNDRVDFKKIRTKFGSKSELARPDEVKKVVGVPIGAVCPILVGVSFYLDGKVMDLNNVHMGSGDLEYGLEMRLEDLLKAIGIYKVLDLSV